jgi:hypothetical protein
VEVPLQDLDPDAETAAMGAAEEEAQPLATEDICEILVWRGYTKTRFYARLDLPYVDAAEGEFAVAESPSFRFRGNGTPDPSEAAKAAHQALVDKLFAKGWERVESDGPWYAARFRRPLEQR